MYARTTTIQAQPGKVEEAIDIVRESIVPLAKEQPGFKGLMALTSTEDEDVVLLSLWETEDDLKVSEDNGYYEDQIGKLSSVFVGRALREVYEVNTLA